MARFNQFKHLREGDLVPLNVKGLRGFDRRENAPPDFDTSFFSGAMSPLL